MATYSKKSLYYRTGQTNWSLDYFEDRPVKQDISDQFIIIDNKYANNPQLLSYDLYGSKEYWWILYKMNMDTIKDPFRDFKEGVLLRIPTKARIGGIG